MLRLFPHIACLCCLALPLAGCERDPTVLEEGALGDAGADAAADAELAQRRYEDLKAILTAHPWRGVTFYAETQSGEYEVTFEPDGTYRTRCLEASQCEPFGLGSDGERDHRWELNTLNEDGNGRGRLWSSILETTFPMKVEELHYDAGKAALTFFLKDVPLKNTNPPQIAQVALVVLTPVTGTEP